LVLSEEAAINIEKIRRLLTSGHTIVLGSKGTGKKSLIKLAGFLAGIKPLIFSDQQLQN
jgi:hypothetical protein